MDTGHCPETSRDAKGYNRQIRIKDLRNVAQTALAVCTLYSAET